MIRKSLAFFFTLLPLSLLVLIVASYFKPLARTCPSYFGQGSASITRGLFVIQTRLLESRPQKNTAGVRLAGGPNPFDPATTIDNPLKEWLCDAQRTTRLKGFQLTAKRDTYGLFVTSRLAVSLWIPLTALAIVPVAFLATGPFRCRRRMRKGLCRMCAYNLTGNTSGVCPECGTPTSPPKWWRWAWFPLIALRILPLLIIAGISFFAWHTIRQGSAYPAPKPLPGQPSGFDGIQWEKSQQFIPDRTGRHGT